MKRNLLPCLLFFLLLSGLTSPVVRSARASYPPFIGEIMWVPYNFAPTGWAKCDGQLLPISQHTALFSLLGTQYGGNGTSNFALPNANGRLLVGSGQIQGSSTEYWNGDSGGEDYHTLTAIEIPAHNHTVKASADPGTAASPGGAYFGAAGNGSQYGDNPSKAMAGQALSVAGSSQPHNNMMPYTTLTCIIALQGVFPSRP